MINRRGRLARSMVLAAVVVPASLVAAAPGALAVPAPVAVAAAAPAPVAAAAPAPVAAPVAGIRAAPACGPSRDEQITETPWPLRRMRPDLAWPLSEGEGITVAVIDSGVSATHPALEGKVREGRDFIQPSMRGQCDEVAHGTLVAGVIAGRQPEGSAFSGIAPKATILPIRVLRDTQRDFQQNTSANIATAIEWSVDQGADVINLSLTTEPTPALEAAIKSAVADNVVVVAAAGNDGGNDGSGQAAYPAAYPEVIAVAGVDEAGKHVDSSTTGNYVDVAAPGAEVLGPVPQGGGYAQFEAGGTSFAAAYVSGLAALIRAQNPDLKPAQIAARIAATADHPPEGRNNQVGFGVINPYRALASIPGGSARHEPAGSLASIPRADDPLANTRVLATWTAAIVGGLAIAVLLTAFIIRRIRAFAARAARARSRTAR